ncbi:MAG: Co2+/Mg2+ efflux protein ApaG [Gammaproteobacteria bacterium]|nr:Co2+/Mg2+ efflux protein ApaG [Gammaproteobacteria bacterium]
MSRKVNVTAITDFVEQQSDAENHRFVFSYTITIENDSDSEFQLLSRHWVIQDANRKVEEVYGEGVIGEQPVIKPGESYTYTSGAVLETEMGTMEGRYFMINKSKNEFEVPIPKFVLSVPRTLH